MIEPGRALSSKHITLRPIDAGDLRRLVKWYSDPRVTHFLGRSSAITLAEQERWFRDYERKPDEQVFAIEVAGKHVGNLGLHRVDRAHRKAELGIVIGEMAFWSRGYGTEAIRLALRYAFDDLGLNKVSLDVLDYNVRGIRAYEKCGFVREGVARQEVRKDGRFFDVVRMGVLAAEFRALDGPG